DFGKLMVVEIKNGAHVTMSGITIAGPGPSGFNTLDYGVFVVGGATLNIDHSSVVNIADDPLDGIQTGVAIRAGSQALGEVGHLTATDDVISGYQKGGIVIDGAGSAGTIANDNIQGAGDTTLIAQNGIQISRGATATIANNTISGHEYSGVGS